MRPGEGEEAPPRSPAPGGEGAVLRAPPCGVTCSPSANGRLPSPPWGRGGAPSWRHQDNGRCRRRVTRGCERAGGSPAMVSVWPARPRRPPGPARAGSPRGRLRGPGGRRRGRGEAGPRPARLWGRRGAGLGGPRGREPGGRGPPAGPGARDPAFSARDGLGRCWDPLLPADRRTA